MSKTDTKYVKTGTMSISEIIIDCLLTEKSDKPGFRLTNKQIVEEVKTVHPTAETTPACVAWYVSNLKRPEKRAKWGVDEDRYEMYGSLKADKN